MCNLARFPTFDRRFSYFCKTMWRQIQNTKNRLLDIANNSMLSRNMREKAMEEYDLYVEDMKKINQFKQRKKTLKKHIDYKGLAYYCTLTLINKQLNKGYKAVIELLKKSFDRWGVDYYLVPEYSPEKKRLHFHGFINADNELIKWSGLYDEYGNKIYNLLPYAKIYGHSVLVWFIDKPEKIKNKMLNYTIKYVLKTQSRALANRGVRVKNDKLIKMAIAEFGDLVVVE